MCVRVDLRVVYIVCNEGITADDVQDEIYSNTVISFAYFQLDTSNNNTLKKKGNNHL